MTAEGAIDASRAQSSQPQLVPCGRDDPAKCDESCSSESVTEQIDPTSYFDILLGWQSRQAPPSPTPHSSSSFVACVECLGY